MKYSCPCCGAALDTVPYDALRELEIGPNERAVLTVLLDRYPRSVSRDTLVNAVWGDRPDGGPLSAYNILSVTHLKLRSKIEPLGWTISKSFRGRGMHRLKALAQ